MPDLFNNLAEFGMAGIIFGGFLLTLRWVFDVNHKILTGMDKERECSQMMLKAFAENIKEIQQANKDFKLSVEESHRCQREEHRQMIESLGRINGYKNN